MVAGFREDCGSLRFRLFHAGDPHLLGAVSCRSISRRRRWGRSVILATSCRGVGGSRRGRSSVVLPHYNRVYGVLGGFIKLYNDPILIFFRKVAFFARPPIFPMPEVPFLTLRS